MNRAMNVVWQFSLLMLMCFCSRDDDKDPPGPPPPDIPFYQGMDLSYQSFLEDYDVIYLDAQGQEITDLFGFVKENGINLVRVRLFHTPDPSDPVMAGSDLEHVLSLCRKISAVGCDIMLDIHYSDTWADPGHQSMPAAWKNLSFTDLEDSVYQYTKMVLTRMQLQQTLPAIVQIGNETNSGFLWDAGKLWTGDDDDLADYVALVNSAERAVSETETATDSVILTMIHYGGTDGAENFFTDIIAANARFDMIGLSYYFLYHSKDLNRVALTLNTMAVGLGKPILIAETTYPFTLEWNDQTHNVVGLEEQLIYGYPATPEGQKAYFMKLKSMMRLIPDDLGAGFVWWAPDLVAFDGPASTNGSAFENLAAWDFSNKALPVFEVFKDP